ncbi:unnamed protein product [Allacma fusca]|uniref:Uncharacterized protein n=1 Tax=Allacma fusca TaxID=39272 RepID=A0A8J2PLP5_9HEXA|nr:unnamed protein product [Allacma fusca]
MAKIGLKMDPANPFKDFLQFVKKDININQLGPNNQAIANLEALTYMAHVLQQCQTYVCQLQWPHKY